MNPNDKHKFHRHDSRKRSNIIYGCMYSMTWFSHILSHTNHVRYHDVSEITDRNIGNSRTERIKTVDP
ncbi:hypothetical protein BYT27DRAFT_7199332 [Phlegmacium glaucopus]|nr:hypothetical protein BYT27DRAFT_7199332 [Phlegmacium glaucopus]